jgi:hypothetical protein
MEKAIDIKSVIEAETAKAVICQTHGIRQASATKHKEDQETMLRTEGVNIFVSCYFLSLSFFMRRSLCQLQSLLPLVFVLL